MPCRGVGAPGSGANRWLVRARALPPSGGQITRERAEEQVAQNPWLDAVGRVWAPPRPKSRRSQSQPRFHRARAGLLLVVTAEDRWMDGSGVRTRGKGKPESAGW